MSYTLSYSSITRHRAPIKSQFGGSSKYAVMNGDVFEKSKQNVKPKLKVDILTTVPNIDDYGRIIEGESILDLTGEQVDTPPKSYKLNKSKVRKRSYALSRLEKSKKFLAFYTVTFPEGLPDSDCYKLYNTWLTRCRKTGGLTTYLWVAERQKNDTIHFHMLTNDFMPIKIVNGYMAKALSNMKKKGHDLLTNVDTSIYNGIDVKKVGSKRKTIIGYLTKYITKNDITFYRYPWHCSRNVSKLFTSQQVEDYESDTLLDRLPVEKFKYAIHDSDFCMVAAFKFIPDDKVFVDIDNVNEMIYKAETAHN